MRKDFVGRFGMSSGSRSSMFRGLIGMYVMKSVFGERIDSSPDRPRRVPSEGRIDPKGPSISSALRGKGTAGLVGGVTAKKPSVSMPSEVS